MHDGELYRLKWAPNRIVINAICSQGGREDVVVRFVVLGLMHDTLELLNNVGGSSKTSSIPPHVRRYYVSPRVEFS